MKLAQLQDIGATKVVTRRFAGRLAVLACLVLAVTSGGCDNGSQSGYQHPMQSDQQGGQAIDHLALVMQYLKRLGPYDPVESQHQLLQHLDRWIETQTVDPSWIEDPNFARLPARFQRLKTTDVLSRRRFDSYDVVALQLAMWLNQTARRVVSHATLEPSVDEWLEPLRQAIDDEETLKDLTETVRLFDWTVRNIQWDAPAKDLPETPGQRANSNSNHRGSKYLVWESLLRGHGDRIARWRVFILLARQRGINVVMLAEDNGPDQEPTPWLPAALIGGQLYLLDMDLGLPVPGPRGAGIATLEQVMADPGLLRQLDLDSSDRYRAGKHTLKRMLALIDATPTYLSQRMRLLEKALPAEHAMVLIVSPASISRSLRRCEGIHAVRLWTAPYDTMQSKQAEYARLRKRQRTWDDFVADEESMFKVHPRKILMGDVLSRSPVAGPLLQLAGEGQSWGGTAAELLDALDLCVAKHDQRAANWPQDGPALAEQLRKLRPNLLALGCKIEQRQRELRPIWSIRRADPARPPTAAQRARLQRDPVAGYISALAEQQGSWSGTASELLDQLQRQATDEQKSRPSWPRGGPMLAERLGELQAELRAAGWQLEAQAEKPRPVWLISRADQEMPLLEGRLKYLRGQIQDDVRAGQRGAKSYYLDCLVPKREIEDYGRDDSASVANGVQRTGRQTAADQAERRDKERQLIYRIKQTASYWLGLIAMDSGDFDVAVNYLGKRTLDTAPNGPWASGARYNLARALEALGRQSGDRQQLQQARENYLADTGSPQRYGNHLRARRLKHRLDAAGGSEADSR